MRRLDTVLTAEYCPIIGATQAQMTSSRRPISGITTSFRRLGRGPSKMTSWIFTHKAYEWLRTQEWLERLGRHRRHDSSQGAAATTATTAKGIRIRRFVSNHNHERESPGCWCHAKEGSEPSGSPSPCRQWLSLSEVMQMVRQGSRQGART